MGEANSSGQPNGEEFDAIVSGGNGELTSEAAILATSTPWDFEADRPLPERMYVAFLTAWRVQPGLPDTMRDFLYWESGEERPEDAIMGERNVYMPGEAKPREAEVASVELTDPDLAGVPKPFEHMPNLLKTYPDPAALIKRMAERELELEAGAIKPRADLIKRLRKSHKQGLKAGFKLGDRNLFRADEDAFLSSEGRIAAFEAALELLYGERYDKFKELNPDASIATAVKDASGGRRKRFGIR